MASVLLLGQMSTRHGQSQFVLKYTPTNQARDGKERNLRIEVAETFDGKRMVAIKQTHVVTPSK